MPAVTSYEIDPTNHQGMLSDYPRCNHHKLGNEHWYFGPDTNNGVLGSASDHTIRAWLSTDGTATWSEQDGANRKAGKYSPTANERRGAQQCSVSYHAGTGIFWIGYFLEDGNANTAQFILTTFNPTTKLWGVDITGGPTCLIVRGQQTLLETYQAQVAARTDGVIVVVYNGTWETILGVDYDRLHQARYDSNTSTWLSIVGTELAGQAGNSRFYWLHGIVRSGNIIHVLLQSTEFTSPSSGRVWKVHHVSINSAGSVSAMTDLASDVTQLAGSGGGNTGCPPVIGNDGAIYAGYARNVNGNTRIGVVRGNPASSALPSWGSVEDPAPSDNVNFFALGSGTLAVFYANQQFNQPAWAFLLSGAPAVTLFYNYAADNVIAKRQRSATIWGARTNYTVDVSHSVASLMAGSMEPTAMVATGGNFTTIL